MVPAQEAWEAGKPGHPAPPQPPPGHSLLGPHLATETEPGVSSSIRATALSPKHFPICLLPAREDGWGRIINPNLQLEKCSLYLRCWSKILRSGAYGGKKVGTEERLPGENSSLMGREASRKKEPWHLDSIYRTVSMLTEHFDDSVVF